MGTFGPFGRRCKVSPKVWRIYTVGMVHISCLLLITSFALAQAASQWSRQPTNWFAVLRGFAIAEAEVELKRSGMAVAVQGR